MTTSYSKYINSSAWQDIRKKYLEKHPYDETILYKGKKVKATDVHHLSYQNLGKEKNVDLIAVCDDTHNILHTYYSPQLVIDDENLTLIYGAGQRIAQFYFLQHQYEQENNIEYNSRLSVKFLNYISNTIFDDMHLKNLVENENPESNKFIQTILNSIIKFKGYDAFVKIYQYYVEKIKPDFIQTMNKTTNHNTIDDAKTQILNSFSLDEIQDALKLYILIKGIKGNSTKKSETQKPKAEKVEKKSDTDNMALMVNGKYNHYSQKQLKTFLGREINRKTLGAAKSYMGQYYLEQTNEYPYFNKCAKTADKFVDYIKNHGDNGIIVLKNYLSTNF